MSSVDTKRAHRELIISLTMRYAALLAQGESPTSAALHMAREGNEPSDVEEAVVLHREQHEDDEYGPDGEIPEYVKEYNARYAVVNLEGKCVILNQCYDPVLDRPDFKFSTVGDFKLLNANKIQKFNTDDGKVVEFQTAPAWIKSPHRRQYDGVMFDPGGHERPNHLNMWKGWSITPKEGDWSIMRDHLKYTVCRGDEDAFAWVMNWIADMFQRPGEKRPGTVPVFIGAQGCGKGIVWLNLAQCIRSHFLHITSRNQLTGNFNAHLKDTLFVFADEAFFAGDKQSLGNLKAMITEDHIMIEPKNVNAFPAKNFCRIAMASNEAWAVPADLGERRFAVFNVDDHHCGELSYFNDMQKQMDNGGCAAMMYELMHREYDPQTLRLPPATNALADQRVYNLTPVQGYWHDCCEKSELMVRTPPEDAEWVVWHEKDQSFTKEEIYHGFLVWCAETHKRYPNQRSTFIKELRQLDRGITHGSGRDSRRLIVFPHPDEAENRWKEYIKTGRQPKESLPF